MKDLFESFKKSLKRLEEVLENEKTIINRDAAIQRFEFTIELAWKCIQKYLREEQIVCQSPKSCFKEAFTLRFPSSQEKTPILRTLRGTRAETLAEVILAFIVFGIVSTAGMMFVVRGIDTNQEIEERLIAYNFARESVEAVRNLRDTNWLRFPGYRTECWDVMLDTTSSLDCATTGTHLGDSAGVDYIVYPEITETTRLFAWNFVEVDPAATDDLTIYETDITSNATPIYTQDLGCGSGVLSCVSTGYRRTINVVATDTDTVPDGYADILTVTATVSWESKADTRTITFVDELTNY
jgi:nucleotidyltransferase substrate binding protein (TIGR01987 family)